MFTTSVGYNRSLAVSARQQSRPVDRIKRLCRVNKNSKQFALLFTTLLQLTAGKYHIGGAATCSKTGNYVDVDVHIRFNMT